MAEAEATEEKKPLARGVVVEFDFTAIDGGQLLFDTAKKTYARRSGQKMVPKKDYDEWKKGIYPVRRGLGLTLPALNNAVPFGSVIMNVNPIEYEE